MHFTVFPKDGSCQGSEAVTVFVSITPIENHSKERNNSLFRNPIKLTSDLSC